VAAGGPNSSKNWPQYPWWYDFLSNGIFQVITCVCKRININIDGMCNGILQSQSSKVLLPVIPPVPFASSALLGMHGYYSSQ